MRYGWLAHLPAWVVLLLFATVPALIAVGLHAIFRRFVTADKLIRHHEVAGFLVGIAGVLYAVVLGFLVATVWVSFDSAQATADLEASDVAELFTFASVLSDPARTHLQRSMANYAFEVRDREWPMLVYDRQDVRCTLTALSAALYVALIVGAIILLAFTFLFGVDNKALQFTMTFLIMAMIGLLFGTIVSLDRPYSGPIRVSPQAWNLVIENNSLANYRTIRP